MHSESWSHLSVNLTYGQTDSLSVKHSFGEGEGSTTLRSQALLARTRGAS